MVYYLYMDRTELADTKLYFVGDLNNVSYIVEKLPVFKKNNSVL